MTEERPPSAGPRFARGALLGAASTTGWLLNDMAVFATSGLPSDFLALVPGSLVALGIGALLGALAGRFPALILIYAAAGFAALSTPSTAHGAVAAAASPLGLHAPDGKLLAYLGTVLVGWSLTLAIATLAHRTLGLSAPRTAACLAVVAAIWVGDIAQGELRPHWQVVAGAALLVLLLGLKRVPLRRPATAAVLLGASLFLAYKGLPETRTSYWRDDLPPPTAQAGTTPNAILVVLDTVRAESLAPYGSERVTSPRLDQWVREHATVFTESRSTSSFTLASHGSLFTGVLPAQHQAARLRPAAAPLTAELPTLAERLRENGLQTAAIAANHTYLNTEFGMDRGFEHFDFRKGSLIGRYLPLAQLFGHTIWAGHLSYRDGHSITSSALDWLDRRRTEDPFFLMLNYLDAHTPYIPRAPHNALFEDVLFTNPFGVPKKKRELAYDRCIHDLDEMLGRLLDGIEERGLLDGTLIVITSDHGEAFGEHGFVEHCWTLYDEMVKVPLYIKPADGRRAERDDRPVNSADLMWLMLDELGIPYDPPESMQGLVAEWYRQVPMTEKYLAMSARMERDLDRDLVAWIEGQRKYIVSTRREVEAFDLGADPEEQHPLELTQEEADRALAKAMRWWDEHPLAAVQTEEISEEDMERLRALGYVGEEEDEE